MFALLKMEKNEIYRRHQALEQEISDYNGDDPLKLRYDFISWLDGNYGRENVMETFVPVLEDTLKSFWNAVKYQQDIRFIQLVTTYINMQKNPLEIYKSVYDKGTGTESALFYTSWANAFVEKENYKKADEIYNLGLSKVKSKTELKSAYENFLVSLGKKYLHLSKNNLWETVCPKCCENQKSESAQRPPQTSCDVQSVGYFMNPLKVGEKDDFMCPMFVEDPPDPSKIPMYPKHLVYRDGKEYSLEEVRAIILKEKYKNKEAENSQVLHHTTNDSSKKMTDQNSEDNSSEKEFCKENINQENNILPRQVEPLKCHTTSLKHPVFPNPMLLQDSLTVSQTSYTAHMKEAMNVVQEMWSSPSPAVAPVTNLHPRGRSLFSSTTDPPKEAPLTDENIVASVAKKTPFSVYTEEEEEDQQQPKNYLPTPIGTAKTGIQKAKTSVKKDPLQLKDHAKGLNALSERKPKGTSDVQDLLKRPVLLPNVKQQLPFSNVPQVEDNQNEMLAMKLGDVSISSNNQPSRITNIVKPLLPHDQDDFTDVTCNTKAFNFSLPSSTPIQNKKFSGTRNSTDLQSSELPSQLKSTKNPDLSMILEASKERYSSSSSSNNGLKGQSTVPVPVLAGKNVDSISLARRLKKGESKIMDDSSGNNYKQLNQNLLINRSLEVDKKLNVERRRIFNDRYNIKYSVNLHRKHSLQCQLTGTVHKKNQRIVNDEVTVENLKKSFEKCCSLDVSFNKESIKNAEEVGKPGLVPTLNESFSNSSKRILQESNFNCHNLKNETNDKRIYGINKYKSSSVNEENLGKEIKQSNQSQRKHSAHHTKSSTLLSDKFFQVEDKLVKTKIIEKVNETEPLESENKENCNSSRSFRKKRSQSIQTREVSVLKLNKKNDIKGQISGGNLRKRTKSLLDLKLNSINYTLADEELSSKKENQVKTKKNNRSSSEPVLVFTNDRTSSNLKMVDKNENIPSNVNNCTVKEKISIISTNVSCNKTNTSSRRGRKKSGINEVRIIQRRSERLFEKNNKKLQEICFKSSAEQDIDPFCPKLQAKLLRNVNFPQSYHSENYFVFNSSFPTLGKTLKLGNEIYNILGDIGKGAYARVVKASVKNRICALKVEKPACKWEHYICREIQKRVPSSVKSLFMDIKNTFIFNGGSILESEWAQYGNLLNITNQYRIATGKVLDSSIVLHFSIELVQIIDFLHQCQIIHADIKPDNFVVRSLPSCNETQGCIQLIDFGRSIDMRLLPAGTQFTTVVKTEGFTCCEMRERKPWSYQTDLYGLAATIHCLIFNEYMITEKKNNEWKLNKPLPRNCRRLWEPIFSSLLNVESSENLPSLTVLKSMLEEALNSKDKYVLSQNYRSLENILKGK